MVSAVVLVVTRRALEYHGEATGQQGIKKGFENVEKHIESCRSFGFEPVIVLNQFQDDTTEEMALIDSLCSRAQVPFAISNHFTDGPQGALSAARLVVEHAGPSHEPSFLYALENSFSEKVQTIANKVYGADNVVFSETAEKQLMEIEKLGMHRLPVCIAKTPLSLSDNRQKRGRVRGFTLTVRSLEVANGAGFIVALCGKTIRMPGLPEHPQILN